MIITKHNERGIGQLEGLLVIVIVAVIGSAGWYVYHTKQNTDKTLNAAATTSNNAGPRFVKNTKAAAAAATSGVASNANLQSDQQSASSSANQGSKDLSASNDSLNDQSTMASVPQ